KNFTPLRSMTESPGRASPMVISYCKPEHPPFAIPMRNPFPAAAPTRARNCRTALSVISIIHSIERTIHSFEVNQQAPCLSGYKKVDRAVVPVRFGSLGRSFFDRALDLADGA